MSVLPGAASRQRGVARDGVGPELRLGPGPELDFRGGPDDGGGASREDAGVRVLVVDDHAGFRAWARVLLERAGYAVVGEAADGASGIAAARRARPELVLLDVQVPDADGFALAERLCAERWAPAVVLTSTRDASDYGQRLQRSRALGFVPKDELSAEALGRLLGARAGPAATSGRAARR
jgi:DNA-binding NarL/FixJ family response regulator